MKSRITAHDAVLKALGTLLLIAAVLKAHELLTVPVANKDLWSWRPFLILQVEFELAMGIWLLSGLFKSLAWLVSLTCFGLFCCVALYKGLTGAASCGCFGTVHVNPWITLLAIDLPAVVLLSVLRPALSVAPVRTILRWQESIQTVVRNLLGSITVSRRLIATAGSVVTISCVTAPILALHEPPTSTSVYEVLEPETWLGKELPILAYTNSPDQLKQGWWLALLYHHDCPNCQRIVPEYEQLAGDLVGKSDFLRIASIELPPYGPPVISGSSPCVHLQLADVKEWFVTTPVVALMHSGRASAVWERRIPNLEEVVERMIDQQARKSINEATLAVN